MNRAEFWTRREVLDEKWQYMVYAISTCDTSCDTFHDENLRQHRAANDKPFKQT